MVAVATTSVSMQTAICDKFTGNSVEEDAVDVKMRIPSPAPLIPSGDEPRFETVEHNDSIPSSRKLVTEANRPSAFRNTVRSLRTFVQSSAQHKINRTAASSPRSSEPVLSQAKPNLPPLACPKCSGCETTKTWNNTGSVGTHLGKHIHKAVEKKLVFGSKENAASNQMGKTNCKKPPLYPKIDAKTAVRLAEAENKLESYCTYRELTTLDYLQLLLLVVIVTISIWYLGREVLTGELDRQYTHNHKKSEASLTVFQSRRTSDLVIRIPSEMRLASRSAGFLQDKPNDTNFWRKPCRLLAEIIHANQISSSFACRLYQRKLLL